MEHANETVYSLRPEHAVEKLQLPVNQVQLAETVGDMWSTSDVGEACQNNLQPAM